MVLFSRSFLRKRAISLVTTASVAATSFALAQNPTRAYHVRGAIPIQYVADRPDYSDEQPFLSENDAAMNKMMADMTIKPTGDVDCDFVAMMVSHHQGAIDMAKAELKYGHNELLRRLAREIVTNQQQEITVMRLAVDDERSSSTGSSAQTPAESVPQSSAHNGMAPHEGMSLSQ
jgi:ribosomal protein L16 Arg81 hydroxylase